MRYFLARRVMALFSWARTVRLSLEMQGGASAVFLEVLLVACSVVVSVVENRRPEPRLKVLGLCALCSLLALIFQQIRWRSVFKALDKPRP